jgi:hypothetical protein
VGLSLADGVDDADGKLLTRMDAQSGGHARPYALPRVPVTKAGRALANNEDQLGPAGGVVRKL